MTRPTRLLTCVLLLSLGCGDDGGPPNGGWYVPEEGTPEAVAYESGLTRYLPMADPVAELPQGDGTTTFEFDPEDGPMCLRGDPYRMSIRETESNDLLIFMQGGGACWSDFCFAVTKAPEGIPGVDVLDPALAANPFADWDVVYLPYCDGSLFAGDAEHDDDGDGVDERIHHGLQNTSAALTMARERFPDPARVVLAGSSGGGFGTLMASALVRYTYPDAPLFVVNDSGVGVADPNDPTLVDTLLDEFGARQYLPDDCDVCVRNGHIAGLAQYLLDEDPNARVGVISSWYDFVISELFLMIPSTDFRDALDAESTTIHQAHPDRYRRFIYDGGAHTALLGDPTGIIGADLTAVEVPPDLGASLAGLELESLETAASEGVMLSTWLTAMVAEDDAGWSDLVEPAGTPPM